MNHKCPKCGEKIECKYNAWIDTTNLKITANNPSNLSYIFQATFGDKS